MSTQKLTNASQNNSTDIEEIFGRKPTHEVIELMKLSGEYGNILSRMEGRLEDATAFRKVFYDNGSPVRGNAWNITSSQGRWADFELQIPEDSWLDDISTTDSIRPTIGHVMYVLYNNEPVPEGKQVLHQQIDGLDHKDVNPAHLYAGTETERQRERLYNENDSGVLISPEDAIDAILYYRLNDHVTLNDLSQKYGAHFAHFSRVVRGDNTSHEYKGFYVDETARVRQLYEQGRLDTFFKESTRNKDDFIVSPEEVAEW